MTELIEKKRASFQDMVQRTVLHMQHCKVLVFSVAEVTRCIDKMTQLSRQLSSLDMAQPTVVQTLQQINNELSLVFKQYGTWSLEDLTAVCVGNGSQSLTPLEQAKMELLNKYFHPTGYKVLTNKEEELKHLSCTDVLSLHKHFHMKVYGIRVCLHAPAQKKALYITGWLDPVIVPLLSNPYLQHQSNLFQKDKPTDAIVNEKAYAIFCEAMTLKEYLIFNTVHDVYAKFSGWMTHGHAVREKPIAEAVREFIADDLYSKRVTLMALLLRPEEQEYQHLAYLLYSLLSNDANGHIETYEQTLLTDSLPWSVKKLFNHAMNRTVQYTNNLSQVDLQKIPLEHQICLLKVPESVKEKAMAKLKEIKSKSEDTGSKARHYLEGLLKIPFGCFVREPILHTMDEIRFSFKELCAKYASVQKWVPLKDSYTSVETRQLLQVLERENEEDVSLDEWERQLARASKSTLLEYNRQLPSPCPSKCTKAQLKEHILKHHRPSVYPWKEGVVSLQERWKTLATYMDEVKNTLDRAVYGHTTAKRQIERIIGQWISGEQQGYCFGFEGPPGIGKTSLAKRGIADCLKDAEGRSRPFAMIQMGGDSNGSTLHGHNYTYVGSTWGSIVQILMDKKCMNPIIFIDEVDKISRTEHGREIVGILTHLLDPAQNDCFQDKYFNGIDLDLSKALFILSYNDADAIDKVLLDRVHRIKFQPLSLEDKLVVCDAHLLPEIRQKMGLEGAVHFSRESLTYLIENYTCESGVRKLKELLFEIVGEINVELLRNVDVGQLPIEVTRETIKQKYCKHRREWLIRSVPKEPLVGYANGMYATTAGRGGTLPIHAKLFPSKHFLELKLTGLQQDVMRESMHVALTVAWNMTPSFRRRWFREQYDGANKSGINVHTGDNAVQKDGPSAGGIIAIAIYSLLNDVPVRPCMAMTGEIQMSGHITAIGGLSCKIMGSLKAGIKTFLYPRENQQDMDEFMEKYGSEVTDVGFYAVDHLSEAMKIMLIE